MRKLITCFITIAIACSQTLLHGNEGLDAQISERLRQLEELNREVKIESDKHLPTTKNLEIEISYRPIAEWLSKLTHPGLTIVAQGVQRHGDLYYNPGNARAWLEPESKTKVEVTMADLRLTGGSSGSIGFAGRLAASASTTVSISAIGFSDKIPCGFSDQWTLSGKFTLGRVVNFQAPYSLSIQQPSSIKVDVTCDFPKFGKETIPFEGKGFVQDVKGFIDVGISGSGSFVLPSVDGTRVFTYNILAKNTELTNKQFSLEYKTDLDVKVVGKGK